MAKRFELHRSCIWPAHFLQWRRGVLLCLLTAILTLSACLHQKAFLPDNRTRWIRQKVPVECVCTADLLPDSLETDDTDSPYPAATTAMYAVGYLWTANASGLLTRWNTDTGDYRQYHLPDGSAVISLATDDRQVFAGSDQGSLWTLDMSADTPVLISQETGRISAISLDKSGNLWYASASRATVDGRQVAGQGIIQLTADGRRSTFTYLSAEVANADPSRHITALVFDRTTGALWAGTPCCGILRLQPGEEAWEQYAPGEHPTAQAAVLDLEADPDGVIYAASAGGLLQLVGKEWRHTPLPGMPVATHLHSLESDQSGDLWMSGDTFVGRVEAQLDPRLYAVADNPLLADRTDIVTAAPNNQIWFIGRRGRVHFDGSQWTAYDADARRFTTFNPVIPHQAPPPPIDFPPPQEDYLAWLRTWPRPAGDNGLGLHFLQSHQFDGIEAQRQVNRLRQLGLRWTVVTYQDTDHLRQIAPIFQAAGISVIWRPFVRPYAVYAGWQDDVSFLRARGIAPYMQLYNEPSLEQEWADWGPADQELFLEHLMHAASQVYDSGGYVGLQFVDSDWLVTALGHIQGAKTSHVLDRIFFVPHLYGLNHPPDYSEDINSVLGFREYASLFQREIGFVPPMLVGEGGWRPGESQDNRYPPVSAELHRDYHMAVFNSFRTGTSPDGSPLPDYLFTFCPWLLADPNDPAAWFDSQSGDRTLTIQAAARLPTFERHFSWDQQTP